MDRLEALTDNDGASIARFALANGYVLLRGCLESPLIHALAALVDQAWAAAPGDLPALHQRVLPSPELDKVRRHPAVLEALTAILGPCSPEHGDVVRYVLPADPPTPAHQDAHYVRLDRRIWTAWMPLGDCPRALGSLAVWPGSHALGLLPHDGAGLAPEALKAARWASADLASGDVILFDSRTAHKALPNRLARPRRSIDCRYCALE